MRIYIASSFDNKVEVRALRDQLIALGHTITWDWTDEEELSATATEKEIYDHMAKCADDDLRGVESADMLILIDTGRCKAAMTEFGVSSALRIPGIVIQPVGMRINVFQYLPWNITVRSTDAALEALRTCT